ncbi:MAG: DUF1272 domain-containing protein [Gammaproteobacteria bacterium]|nr:MAG: DUF1272 domain-containing protein [Gammaproteobacteria bacterium]
MLELRPGCEACGRMLPPSSTEAMICSFECTFCRVCVQTLLMNVCPNCGGGLSQRPIRPKAKLAKNPASTRVLNRLVDAQAHAAFAASIKDVPPELR